MEVQQATAPFTAGGKSYPVGSCIVKLDQPYRNFAKTVLERQKYPGIREYPGGPPQRPYDGKGRIIAFGFIPMYRGLSDATYKFVLNAALYATSTPTALSRNEEAWHNAANQPQHHRKEVMILTRLATAPSSEGAVACEPFSDRVNVLRRV